MYHRPITIEKINEDTEQFETFLNVHSRINKTRGDEYFKGGASKSKATLEFNVRFNSKIAQIEYNTEDFRIISNGQRFNILDYDDFMQRHKNIKLIGESY